MCTYNYWTLFQKKHDAKKLLKGPLNISWCLQIWLGIQGRRHNGEHAISGEPTNPHYNNMEIQK